MLIRQNKKYRGFLKPSHWRRIALGSWAAPHDPTLYAIAELNIEPALNYIETVKAKTGERVTLTHFVGKVWGILLKLHPELNSEIRWGKFYRRAQVDIAFQVVIEKGKDQGGGAELSAGVIRNIDQTPLSEIAKQLNRSAHVIRTEDDPNYRALKKGTSPVPGIFFRPLLIILGYILNVFNLWSPLLGIPQDSFGSMMITNVGSLGVDWAFPALYPPANHVCILAIGASYKGPVYETDAQGTVTRTTLKRFVRLFGAFDHRYVDGIHAARVGRDLRKIFEEPEKYNV